MRHSPLIAVVDDDQRVLESLENLLESAQYRVCLFSSAEAFLGSADLQHAQCLISDIYMPGLGGLQLLRELGVARPDLPVVLMTAHESASQNAARATNCGGVLKKPFERSELFALLARLLSARSS